MVSAPPSRSPPAYDRFPHRYDGNAVNRLNGRGGANGRFSTPLSPELPFRSRPAPTSSYAPVAIIRGLVITRMQTFAQSAAAATRMSAAGGHSTCFVHITSSPQSPIP